MATATAVMAWTALTAAGLGAFGAAADSNAGAVRAAAPPSATALPSEPALVSIPPSLRARVPMLELSGIAWAQALDRYLVVIDDTVDLDEGARHAPFVLALDRAGRLDADPLAIVGVDEVNDAEALAAGPNDTFFLLTSHSPNRRARIHKPRRQLLELRLEGRQLRVTGALNLFHGHHDLTDQLEALGLPADTSVDLEGLAYRDGALYIGMKAPLLTDGAAAILRLDRPGEAFARGKLGKHNLSVWGEVKLAVEGYGNPQKAAVFEGIADMFFAADGVLYLCANSPKGGAKDGGGALWRVAAPRGGRLEAALVRRFARLKPEGVTAEPAGSALTLVFDRDQRDPFWMTWPVVDGRRRP